MNESEFILQFSIDDIYNDMRGYITNNDYINLENTLEYLISLDPNAFNTYYYLNRLILTAMGRLGDFHHIKSLQLLLKYGAQINTILGILPAATRYAVNLLYNNMTIFTRIIYNLLRDISDGLDLNTHINEKNEIYTMFKIILNYPIDYNKGDPNFFDVLELHPNEAHIVLEIFDRASIDINKFKSEQRLSFAKSFPKTGLPENLYNSVMEHLDYDAFQELGTYINKDKYSNPNPVYFDRYDPNETYDTHLSKKHRQKQSHRKFTKRTKKSKPKRF